MTTGERIKQRRIELNWSLRDLSNRMGYANHSTIARIESGKVDIPQSRIVQFAEVLNTSVAYLMGWEEVQKKNDTLTDIVIRLRQDAEFLSLVETLYNLDSEKLKGVTALLSAFSTTDK